MAMYKKTRNINELRANDQVKDIFVVRFAKPVEKTKNNTFYFSLKIQDGFGDMMLKYWGNENEDSVKKLYESIKPDSIIFAEGTVKNFNNALELSINNGNLKVLQKGEYNLSDFIRKSEKNTEEMFVELKKIIASIKNPELKMVLNSFFEDKAFAEKFKTSPAAMYKHHGWVSGLLEHTLSVVNICKDIAKYHKLDQDLLLTGAILHDIGKIEEFETTSLIKVTDKGNLLGHITLGVQMLSEKLGSLDVSELTKNKLLHILISHHGSLEFGCPKLPSFPEAFIIAKADELDALAMQMIDYKENAKTEDNFLYSKDFKTNIYLK
jgi:3'-5' exoribonuclease